MKLPTDLSGQELRRALEQVVKWPTAEPARRVRLIRSLAALERGQVASGSGFTCARQPGHAEDKVYDLIDTVSQSASSRAQAQQPGLTVAPPIGMLGPGVGSVAVHDPRAGGVRPIRGQNFVLQPLHQTRVFHRE